MRLHPFTDGDIGATLRNLIEKTQQEISALDSQYVLRSAVTELEDFYLQRLRIQPLLLRVDDRVIENQSSTQMDVSRDFNRAVVPGRPALIPGTRLDIAIPYEGDQTLWRLRPSQFRLSGYPEIQVRDDSITITYCFADDSPDANKLQDRINRDTEALREAVEYIRNDVENEDEVWGCVWQCRVTSGEHGVVY